MCGIIGYTGAEQAAPILLEGLKRLAYRGYDSAGVAVAGPGGLSLRKTAGRVERLAAIVGDGACVPGLCGVGHTRWATHGAPDRVNAHPHLSADGRIAVVHNGIIANHEALRQELAAQGVVFRSQTDTEVAAQLIARCYRGDLAQAVRQAVGRLTGTWALGVICADQPGVLVAARCGSPLLLGVGNAGALCASDPAALAAFTSTVTEMEDGDVAEITPRGIAVTDDRGRAVDRRARRITWRVEDAEKGGFAHFMLKEIMEQPRAVASALDAAQAARLPRALTAQTERILLTGCGSAFHAGCAARFALEQFTGLAVEVIPASELRDARRRSRQGTLVAAVSQSGETADTIAALALCREDGAHTLGIVNVEGSTIARQAEHTLLTCAGPEIAVATTKGYTTQLAMLHMLAVQWGEARGTIGGAEAERLRGELLRLPNLLERTLGMNPHLPEAACVCAAGHDLYYVGRQADHAAALEGALKMKEVACLHAEALPAGEMKHGPLALIRRGQAVAALCCEPHTAQKTAATMAELRSRGAWLLALTPQTAAGGLQHADALLRVPDCPPLLMPVAEALPLQLLAYHAALARGCDVDQPPNLAKSVTVE